jgi:hypothetical protein
MKKTFTNSAWVLCLGLVLTATSFNAKAQNASVAIVPGGPVICEGDTLKAVVTGLTGPYTYQWSNGASDSFIVPSNSGFYRVRVTGTNTNGVTRTVSTNLTPFTVVKRPTPTIFVDGPSTLCPGQSVDLIAKGRRSYSSYSWNTGETTPKITVNQSGTFVLTVTNSLGGCSFSADATVDINVLDNGYQPAITALTPAIVCQPGFVTLGADAGFSNYTWSNGGSAQTTTILMDGSGGGPVLDTTTVYLTVELNGLCSFSSAGFVVRSIRQPELRPAFCGNYGLTLADSIQSGIVLSYITDPQYDFEFEETTAPGITWNYLSDSRWVTLSSVSPLLEVNKFYNVRVRGVVDGVPYCYGNVCQIGVVASPSANDGARVAGNTIATQVFPNPSLEGFNLLVSNTNADQPTLVNIFDVTGRMVDTFEYTYNAGLVHFGDALNSGVYFLSVQQGETKNVTRLVKSN